MGADPQGEQFFKLYFFQMFLNIPFLKYQPSGAGGTRSPPATPHRLQRRTACNAAEANLHSPNQKTKVTSL